MSCPSGEELDRALAKIAKQYGFARPDRGDLDNPNIQWREGRPDYRKADLSFFKGRTTHHKPGSLPFTVENLVKEWEMEISHKTDPKDWKTMDAGNSCVQVNGGREIPSTEAAGLGTYNWVMENVPETLYDASLSYDNSHELFRGTFLDGFPWEVLEVFTGPPKVAFSWRHWGVFNGQHKERKGRGELVELYGVSVATVSQEMKILKVEVYAKFDDFLKVLHGTLAPEEARNPFTTPGCPIYHGEKSGSVEP